MVLRLTLATRSVFSVPDPLDSATLHIIQTAGRTNSVSASKPRTSFPQPRRLVVVTSIMSGVSRHTSHNVADKCFARRTSMVGVSRNQAMAMILLVFFLGPFLIANRQPMLQRMNQTWLLHQSQWPFSLLCARSGSSPPF